MSFLKYFIVLLTPEFPFGSFVFIISTSLLTSLLNLTCSSYLSSSLLHSFHSVNLFLVAALKSFSGKHDIWSLSQAVSVACFPPPPTLSHVWVTLYCFLACLIIFCWKADIPDNSGNWSLPSPTQVFYGCLFVYLFSDCLDFSEV